MIRVDSWLKKWLSLLIGYSPTMFASFIHKPWLGAWALKDLCFPSCLFVHLNIFNSAPLVTLVDLRGIYEWYLAYQKMLTVEGRPDMQVPNPSPRDRMAAQQEFVWRGFRRGAVSRKLKLPDEWENPNGWACLASSPAAPRRHCCSRAH